MPDQDKKQTEVEIFMAYESNLSVNARYQVGGDYRVKLNPHVAAWQEQLAWELRSALALGDIDFELDEGTCAILDLVMLFPDDGQERDVDNYLKAIFDGVAMGLQMDDHQFIPYIRGVDTVPVDEAGFIIRLYPASFGGHGLMGTIVFNIGGQTCIVLDAPLPKNFEDCRIKVNIGLIR